MKNPDNQSLWKKQTGKIVSSIGNLNKKPDRITWDVIVIGAGMAGVLTAYYLQERGKKVLVLEADTIASGQTGNTTAKITSQHGVKYSQLINTVGIEKARIYARANEKAIQEYERLIKARAIPCQFEKKTAYLYSTQREHAFEQEKKAALSLGVNVTTDYDGELPFPVKDIMGFPGQAQFSPLEFMKDICRELNVLEHSKVLEIRGHMVVTEKKVFTAEKIVMATHYPIIDTPGFYFLRQHQSRSYVLALSGCKRIKGMYYGALPDGLSFRQAGEYLLLGGASHRTGKGGKGGAYDYLEKMARKYYPDCKIEAKWSAQDCMPHDGIPFIGKYSLFTHNLYVITGFQKWGMTSAMIAALILRDELDGVSNPYSKLFTPQRLHWKAGFVNFLKDALISAKGLMQGVFANPRCPHMGCKLAWNPDEKSWDCPCHGSRFKEDGTLLDCPSVKRIEE